MDEVLLMYRLRPQEGPLAAHPTTPVPVSGQAFAFTLLSTFLHFTPWLVLDSGAGIRFVVLPLRSFGILLFLSHGDEQPRQPPIKWGEDSGEWGFSLPSERISHPV